MEINYQAQMIKTLSATSKSSLLVIEYIDDYCLYVAREQLALHNALPFYNRWIQYIKNTRYLFQYMINSDFRKHYNYIDMLLKKNK
jgi:hypothetical protein